MRPLFVAAAFGGLVLGGCKPVGPDYEGAPEVAHSGRFFGSRDSTPAPELDKWWRRLSSRELNALVEQALALALMDCLQLHFQAVFGEARLRHLKLPHLFFFIAVSYGRILVERDACVADWANT